ncbi:YchJ family protein [Corynebacterium epidermidicanis]|uniref:UPF0225 protein CEPID_06110 n=1 Tax=Corynebacterium epidermidicanis TaxID=1050174 RepID=A0A0G3GW36_9CORY|nr:YchJ family metal-binding protein [Corynebacterium epidermidicanis]AKK03082.1 hypothetical protein CEPID_06110 [Corynebacterium epidermidicanis]
MNDSDRCPCCSGLSYGECCGRYHRGAAAPTAEALMRSRFSAFATHNADYLLQTWHEDSRPATLGFDDSIEFFRLNILHTTGGGPFDTHGTVEFEAFYRAGGTVGSQRENSSFTKVDGCWIYTQGEFV